MLVCSKACAARWRARSLEALTIGAVVFSAAGACAQSAPAVILPEVTVKEAPTVKQQFQLPATVETVTADEVAATTNMVNTEDALKYLPSLVVRKRNFGDQKAT